MSDIKILVACHTDDAHIPKNDLLLPIQVGASTADRHFEGMVHDDEGDNISSKNPMYCELTALYWAWKNLDADYYGLFHYRRYFSFADERFASNCFGDVIFDFNDDQVLEATGMDESTMRSVIEEYDILIPEAGGFVDDATIAQQYCASSEHEKDDLDLVRRILDEQHPEMHDAMVEYLNGTSGYFCNMFIMKKGLFFDYCQWIFGILEEFEARADLTGYGRSKMRVCGYLAERLFGIYITYLRSRGSYRIKELQRSLFRSVAKEEEIHPAFGTEKDVVTVVFSANDHFVPYLSATLQSIKENSSPQNKYDLIILHDGITDKNQRTLKAQIEQENISLRFLNATFQMRRWLGKLPLNGHFKEETYFRLLLQDILAEWDKVLYLDSDLIVLRDVADLYRTDLSGYLLAATKDADTAGLYNGWLPGKKSYMDEVLQIREPYDYFQAGVVLFNLEEFRRQYSVDDLFLFSISQEWELLDQDVLNYIAQGKVRFLPMEWNVMADMRGIRISEIISLAPVELYQEYMEARKDPYICHYAGPDKPWTDAASDMAEYFWEYSRKTPYYETVLARALAPEEPEVTGLRRSLADFEAKIYAAYEERFPRDTKEREKLTYLYRKFRGGN